MKTVQQRVKQLMSIYPDTRNCDKKLLIKYWNTFYDVQLTNSQVRNILRAEAPVSIVRARTHIQNTKRELEASPEVQKQRKRQESKFEASYSPLNHSDKHFNYK